MMVLGILLDIFIVILLGILLAVLIMIIKVSYAICHHTCKHCHKIMDYKGLKENGTESHHLFHCPHCGAWEQVDRGVFARKAIGFNIGNHGQACDS